MSVRTKFILTLLSLTLLPLITAGTIGYRRGEQALRESLGTSFQRMATETMEMVDRYLFEESKDIQVWAELELMQEVVTGDLDGRISSFLMSSAKEYGDFVSIDAIDSQGNIVASSDAKVIGINVADDTSFQTAVAGRSLVRDIQEDELSGTPVILFCSPIRAQFDESATVGVLWARWDATELDGMTRALQTAGPQASPLVVLMKADGMAISLPTPGRAPPLEGNLIEGGWRAALLSSRGEEGYVVEESKDKGGFLIGYSHSKGYRDYDGLGWSALVVQDLESAFAPIAQFELILLGIGLFTVMVVGALSLAIGHRVTSPLVRMAEVAKRVAGGDFEGRVGYRSSDEIGTLARGFDKMIEDLERQRALAVQDIAKREQVEHELREAKEVAEESSTTLGAVMNTMGEGIITVDSNGTIVMVNQEVLNIWGYTTEELVGRSTEVLMGSQFVGMHREGLGRYMMEMSSGASKRRLQTEGQRKDGSTFPLEISVAATQIGERRLVTAAVRDITERIRHEEQIKSSLEEKEALLQEIHHRVKNNLQVIISLLNLQSNYVKDEDAYGVFKDSESRIKSMALIHEKLYRSKDLSRIDASEYLQDLAKDLVSTYRLSSSSVSMKVDVTAGLVLGIDTAIHCGLIVNELVSNALKYAFPDERPGEVWVRMEEIKGGQYLLEVKDNGVGLPEGLDLQNIDSLGLQLVSTVVEHLEGTMEIHRQDGTQFEIFFKDVDS